MKQFKVIISIILSITLVVCVFSACKNKDKKESGEAGATVVVTDENGEQVTDENGELVTAIVDENGEIIEQSDDSEVEINNGEVNINDSGKTSKSGSNSQNNNKGAKTTKKSSTPVTKPAKPAKPSNFKAADITKNSLKLTWKGVKCTAYELQFSLNKASGWKTINKATNKTEQVVKGLSPFTTYYFRIRAFNSNSAGKSASAWVVTGAKTAEDKNYERNIKISVKLPTDSNKADTLRIYVNDMKKPVKELSVKCNGTTKSWTTDKKYKGVVKIRVVLVSHGVSTNKETNGDSVLLDISGIGIDQEVDDKEL